MKTNVKRFGFWLAVALTIIAPMQVHAVCQIVGYTTDGYIIECDGSDTFGITSGDGIDIITINVGVDVTKTDLQSVDAIAVANAITIDVGGGNNQVANNGSIGANAGASALPVDGSPSKATAYAVGIKAGDGANVIQNSSTITSTMNSNSESGNITVTLGGISQSQSMTMATANAIGISAGSGNNQMINSGVIIVAGTSQSDAPFIDLNLTDTAYANVSVTAEVTGMGISGQGSIVNQPTGAITVNVSSSANAGNINANIGDSAKADAATKSEATATGIIGSGGNDTITSAGTLAVSATSNAEGRVDLESRTDAEINATIESKATATGIDSGEGDDTINNSSTINTTSKATAKTDKLAASFWAPGVADTTVKSVSQAVGIMGSNGIDTVSNGGNIITHAEATTEVLNLLTSYGVEVALPTDIKGGATSDATAKGINGGDHDDQITNHSGITATSEATTRSDGVLLTYVGIGTFATPTTATAQSIGIDGGKGADTISNNNQIDATATSTATAFSVSVSGFQYEVKSDGDAKTKATAIATGIAGGEGDDRITSTGTITSATNSTASTKDITVEYTGASKGNSSTTAEAVATGIDSATGKDEIINSGAISANATSEVQSLSIDVKRNDIPLDPLEWFGKDLGDARTEARATATGIEGGEGDDTITNSGTIAVSSRANANSYDIVTELGIGSGSEPKKTSASGINLEPPLSTLAAVGTTAQATVTEGEGSEEGNEITNAGTTAKAYATGIAGGADNDILTNNNKISTKAESNANSLSVGVTVSYERSEFLDILGQISLTDTTTTAGATAVGIDGGVGNDTINNTMEVNAEAIANAASTVIKAHLQADFSEEKSGEIEFEIGSALVKSGTVATAIATGIVGGDGNDTITNSGKIIVKATPDSDSASVAATLMGAESGLVVGFTYANAETTAKATSIGIEGGSEKDTITNTNMGQIEVTADPSSSSASVSATITGVTKGKEKVGLAAGGALTDGTTKAIGNATGIYGGEGDDTITNAGRIIVNSGPDADSASVSMNLGATLGELGIVGGFSYADATTTAQATVIGIDGGSGDDTITNTGEIEVTGIPTSSSASVGVTAQGVKGMGAAVGISLTDGTTKAISTTTGIAGGDGNDTITNLGKITVKALPDADSASVSVSISAAKEGVAVGGTLADATTTAQATGTGIDGGEGHDTITNAGAMDVTADAESSSASVSVSAEGTMTGAALGVALSDGTTKAISNAAGIKGEGGNDTISNSSIITVTSTADIASASVSVGLGGAQTGLVAGVAAANVKSTAESTAKGISGGSGDDTIENSMFMMATAKSTISSASVSVNAGIAVNGAAVGGALADGKTEARSLAIGLEGGEGSDTLTNRGFNGASAISEVTAASVAVNLEGTQAGLAGGVSMVDGENIADALAIGISGNGGNDTIANYDQTRVDATTTSKRANVSVTGSFSLYGVALGASFADAANTAKADARGIEGGEGNDKITNASDLTANATTTAKTTSVSVSVNVAIFGAGVGASMASAETTGTALATGIDGGEGDNNIMNASTGSINATSTAHADTVSVSVNLIGAVKATASSTAYATSSGISSGKGMDTIQNEGMITLKATSDTDASASAIQLFGYGDSDAKAFSYATVKGIDGSDGVNTVINSPTGKITGAATAYADASSYDIQLAGGAKTRAGTEATATAIGIAGGKDMDTIRNEGTINFAAQSTLVSESRSFKLFGVGFADANSIAQTFATGIDGGDGANTIANASTGSITVSSNASAMATGLTANIGVAGASASTTSKAHSTGMKSGGGEDTIINEGILNVSATSSTYAGSGDFSLIGLSFGDSLTEATTDGINAGGGNDTIINTGSIIAGSVQDNNHPMAYSNVDSVSFSLFNISSATFGSKAQATGVIGGGGDDTIINQGTISVGDDDWMAKGRAYGFSGQFFDFFSLTSVGATAETVSTGIEGGDGNDTILNDNSGVLTVKATSYARTEGAADTTTFGRTAAFASSTTRATATGISGGEGNDVIENKGTLDVYAYTWADAYSDSWVGWGEPSSDSTADATTVASGINAGRGQNSVMNSGVIKVETLAETTPYAKADSNVDTTDAETKSYSNSTAVGILAGDDGNIVNNAAMGAITVTATATTYDAQGNIAKAESDEKSTVIAGSVNSPITASAVGISLGNGDDSVANDGVIKVSSLSDARGSAYSNSWPYDAQSDATAYAAATSKGIAAGVGVNEIVNNGQINVSAQSNANPITDSWSRDQTAIANATAGSNAVAIGIEADGNMINTSLGNIDVTARATTYADANTEAETTTATATLMATATGLGTTSSAGRTARDWLWNDGNITVTAVAGEDENSTNQEIAYADTDLLVRDCTATAIGTSTVDATGIRVGERGAEITNNGNLEVFGRARAYVRAYADSRDYNPRGNAYSTGIATATGISAAGGDNLINNYSTMKVEARVQDAYTRGDTWSSWSTCRSLAETNATATATGIQTGVGIDEINNYGQLTVVADADAESYAWADTRDNNLADEYETTTARAQADAVGIDAGAGNNSVNHSGSMSVSAMANARAGAGGGHASVTRTEQTATSAVGIQTGSGDDSIVVRSDSNLVATAEGTALDANVRATGIDAGDGINILRSQSSISVVANAISGISAEAKVWGIKTGSSSDRIALETGSLISTAVHATSSSSNGVINASAIGVDAGDGANQITNHGLVHVNADATAEVKREEIFMWSITYPATAESSVTGIKSDTEADIINNYGEIMVNSKASAVINEALDLSAGTKTATANATGIDAGDGDNIVANYGSIDVSALAAAGTGANPNSRTDGVESTTAIGIKTGDGNDTIINSGSITTRDQRLEWVGGWIHITSQPGIAITSGAGSDQVFLLDGSETNGHIDLGEGDDWLTLVGTPMVTGNVTGSAGIDTLVFDGAGSIGFTPMAFENAIKQGPGTYSLASLPTMQRIEIKGGVLKVNDNYQFSDSGFFETFVNGDGRFGQFKVNGTTDLAGDLNVLKGPGPYKNGTTYNIIEANSINDTFSNVMLPPPNNFVSFRMNQFPTIVQIEVYAKDFTWLVRNRVEWAVANYLDRILPSATGDLLGMLGQIQNLSQSEFYKALSTLSPDSYDNFTRNTFSTTHRYNKSLQYRMNNVRSYSHVSQPGNEAPILLAYRGSDVGQLYNLERLSQIQGKNGLWFDAFGQWGDQEEKDGYTGFDYFMRGATLGFDHALSDKFTAGISVGYSRSDINLDYDEGSGYIKSLFGSLYGSYFYKNLYIDGILSYGRNWYDNHRLITIGTDARRAYSKHEGDLFSAYLQGGYYFDIKKWLLGPFASLQYVYLDEESFKEKGAGGVSLNMDGRQTNSLVSELGVRLARVFKTRYGSLIPEVSAAWLHDFDIDDRVITSSFAGFPGASFSVKGQDVDRDGATLGAGITFIHKSGLSTSLRYMGEFREKYKSNGIMGELRFTF